MRLNLMPILALFAVIFIIVIGIVYSQGIYSSVSEESNGTIENETVQEYETGFAWQYILAAVLVIAAFVAALSAFL